MPESLPVPEDIRRLLESLGDTETGQEMEQMAPPRDFRIDDDFERDGVEAKILESLKVDSRSYPLATALFFPEGLSRFAAVAASEAKEALALVDSLRNRSDSVSIDRITQKLETYRLDTREVPLWPLDESRRLSVQLGKLVEDNIEEGTEEKTRLATMQAVRHALIFGDHCCDEETREHLMAWARQKAVEIIDATEEIEDHMNARHEYLNAAQRIAEYYVLKAERIEFTPKGLKLIFEEQEDE